MLHGAAVITAHCNEQANNGKRRAFEAVAFAHIEELSFLRK
jgi:hypothetical protein